MSNIARYKNQQIARPGLLGGTIFDTFFNDFFGDEVFTNHLTKTVQGYPVADIYRSEAGETVMEFALAGFSKEELTVDVKPEKRSITVSAQTSATESDNGRRIARRNFSKTYVNYDDNLDLGQAVAKFENGLLTVTVPPRAEIQPLSIQIQ